MFNSRPNVANKNQVLSKVNDGVNQSVFFNMHPIIKYELDTMNFGLKLKPLKNEKEWKSFVMVHSILIPEHDNIFSKILNGIVIKESRS